MLRSCVEKTFFGRHPNDKICHEKATKRLVVAFGVVGAAAFFASSRKLRHRYKHRPRQFSQPSTSLHEWKSNTSRQVFHGLWYHLVSSNLRNTYHCPQSRLFGICFLQPSPFCHGFHCHGYQAQIERYLWASTYWEWSPMRATSTIWKDPWSSTYYEWSPMRATCEKSQWRIW